MVVVSDWAKKLKLNHEDILAVMRNKRLQSWNESFDKLEENIT